MVFVEGDDYRALRRPEDDPAQFRSLVRVVRAVSEPIVYQYDGSNASTSTWTDSAPLQPQADLSVNGPTKTTINGADALASDGVDDVAVSTAPVGDGPESLPEQSEFGIGFVLQGTDTTIGTWFGAFDGASVFQLRNAGGGGNPTLILFDDSGNELSVNALPSIMTGSPVALVINKNGNSPQDINFYINGSQVGTSTRNNQGFDNSAYSMSASLGVFARNDASGTAAFKDFDCSFLEFREQPFDSSERQDFFASAPGAP
jgi:hypothetical protein